MMKRTTFYAASAGCGSCGLGEDAVTPKTCRFYSHTKSDEAEAVQKTLRLMGATGIKADGLWGACSESAYAKVFGEILTSASLEKNFGIKCSKVDKVFAGSKTCKDGSDAIQPGYTDAPPQDDYVGPTTPALPGGHTTPAVFSRLPLTATSRLAVSKAQTSPKLASALLRPRTAVENALSSGQQTLIPGVPNLVVTIGGIALLGVAGWFAHGAMTKGGGSVKRNERQGPEKYPRSHRKFKNSAQRKQAILDAMNEPDYPKAWGFVMTAPVGPAREKARSVYFKYMDEDSRFW